jgi:hypothetical protein
VRVRRVVDPRDVLAGREAILSKERVGVRRGCLLDISADRRAVDTDLPGGVTELGEEARLLALERCEQGRVAGVGLEVGAEVASGAGVELAWLAGVAP